MTEFTFAVAEDCLRRVGSVHSNRAGTFRARIKQLQRLGFPEGVNVGRGTRMNYSLEHIMKLAIAFELLGMSLPASSVVCIVEFDWPRLAAGVAFAFEAKEYVDRWGVLAVIKRHEKDLSASGLESLVTIDDRASLISSLYGQNERYAAVIVNLNDLARSVIEHLGAANGGKVPETREFIEAHSIETPRSDGRLGDKQWFRIRQPKVSGDRA